MMMERIILGVLCLSGWNISFCLLHQYHYVADHMNWNEAQTYCREMYTDLATIENNEEMTQLMKEVSSVGSKVSEVWIGLYSRIDWKWSGGYRGKGAEYRNWDYSDNEPDFNIPSQLCVCVKNDGGWWDRRCSMEWPFICYRGTQLNPEFVLVNKNMTWSKAQRYCRKNFIDLATVRNHTENQEILSFGWSKHAWIGLFRDPDDHWSDRTESTFRHWVTALHQIGNRSMVCGAALLPDSGKWKLLPCEKRLTFVCYSRPPPPVMRQVVKLRIRGDSSVNLNEPAVKADILKKLQDRLQERGLSGVTLKWREQPDGNVFHEEGKVPRRIKEKKTEL